MQELYSNQVKLPSGGTLIIEHTEALTSIDINSKGYMQEKKMEDTAFKINMEAINEIPKQLILRDIGGLIVIDFIDMENEANISKLNQEAKKLFKEDKAAITIVGYSPLGLMQISRQRLNTSLLQKNYQKCINCNGSGILLKEEIILYSLINQLKQMKIKDKAKIYINGKLLAKMLNEFHEFVVKYKNIQWEIVENDHEKYNKIEILK